MPKQTTADDAGIRAASVQVEELAHAINNRARALRETFNELNRNLKYADPIKDAEFDRFMLTMAHVLLLCDQAPSLAYQAREMQSYGKRKIAEDVSSLNRYVSGNQPAACPAPA